VIAGSTLEDFFTFGLEGDVIARNGNTLTVRGGELFLNANQVVQYQNLDSQVLLGPSTLVTADGIATLGPLNYNSVAVGQHITVRGLYSLLPGNITMIDASGVSSTDTGSVRIQQTELFGSLISSASGSVLLNLNAINLWPASVYNFAGNGASAPTAASFSVNTGSQTLPAAAAGDPLWIDGFVSPFGTAPPDFIAATVTGEPPVNGQPAVAVNAEATVPASLVASWTGTGSAAPFSALTANGLTINLADPAFGSGQLRIGAENVDIKTLSASPPLTIVSATAAPASNGLPLFMPVFSVGPGAVTGSTTNPIQSFNGFAAFVTQLTTTFATPTPATQFVARGFYNRTTNIFTASSIDVVL
jgi:hypothetical protein